MHITSKEKIAGEEIEEDLGVVRGSTIRARNIGRDITQSLKNIIGGELTAYTELMTDAREQAIIRMEKEAEKLDADAIVNLRFMTSMVARGSAEILAYGTAVKLKK